MTETTLQTLDMLLQSPDLRDSDRELALACRKRLSAPLRIAIFGATPKYCAAIANFILSSSIFSPEGDKMYFRVGYGETENIRAQFSNGEKKVFPLDRFSDVVRSAPAQMRVSLNVPVLHKVSLLIATNSDTSSLSKRAAPPLTASDVILWCGETFSEDMLDVWTQLPARTRDHSYLITSSDTDPNAWDQIATEFAGAFRFDPRLALYAKVRKKGVDKEAFRKSGGADVTRLIKRELETSLQSSKDAADVLMMRYAKSLNSSGPDSVENPRARAFDIDANVTDIADRAAQKMGVMRLGS